MRALMFPHFGDAEVLTLTDLAVPSPGPSEVTIDVAYAGVNYTEVLFRKGVVSDLTLPFVPGIEVSGTIRAEVVKVSAELAFPLDESDSWAFKMSCDCTLHFHFRFQLVAIIHFALFFRIQFSSAVHLNLSIDKF